MAARPPCRFAPPSAAVECGEKLDGPTLEMLISAAGGEVTCWRRAKIIIGSARIPDGAKTYPEAWVLDRVMATGDVAPLSQSSHGEASPPEAEEDDNSESEEF